MKIALIGSNGQLGTDILKALSRDTVTALTHQDVDITDLEGLSQTLGSIRPHTIINTAAFHNVPLCEEQTESAMRVNILGARNLACVAKNIEAELVHFSTDYVFDGQKRNPYLETDTPAPLNFYGVTKLAGEHAIQSMLEKHKIIRVSGIYGQTPCRAKGTNFVRTMLDLAKKQDEIKVVDDEWIAPTNTADISSQLIPLLDKPDYGIYHVSNAGTCSWFEFAKAIFQFLDLPVRVTPVPARTFPSPVKRPGYSILANQHLKDAGIYQMPSWQEGLERHLARIKEA